MGLLARRGKPERQFKLQQKYHFCLAQTNVATSQSIIDSCLTASSYADQNKITRKVQGG